MSYPADVTAERDAQRLLTSAFIAAKPTSLTLIPQTPTKTGTGITWTPGTPRPPQTVRIIDQSAIAHVQGAGTVLAGDGKQRKVEYQLLMTWDATLDLHDYWVDADGIRWEVEDLLPNNGYERRAQVVSYGEV